jgi:hypothetical protein
MNEQKRTEELLKSSSGRIKAHSAERLRDPLVKAAVQQEQNPERKKTERNESVSSSRKRA